MFKMLVGERCRDTDLPCYIWRINDQVLLCRCMRSRHSSVIVRTRANVTTVYTRNPTLRASLAGILALDFRPHFPGSRSISFLRFNQARRQGGSGLCTWRGAQPGSPYAKVAVSCGDPGNSTCVGSSGFPASGMPFLSLFFIELFFCLR